MDTALEVVGGLAVSLILMVLGWLHMRINTLSKKIDEVDASKIDHEDFREVKSDVKLILKEITDLKVEQARWQGRAESHEFNRPERS